MKFYYDLLLLNRRPQHHKNKNVVKKSLVPQENASPKILHSSLPSKGKNEIERVLNKNFSMLCDLFVDNKSSFYFGEVKAKSIFFGGKYKIKDSKPLNIQYNDIEIKQYSPI